LHYGLWNPKFFWIDTSGKISDPSIRNSKYVFHIQKSIIKKTFWIHQSVTEVCIPDSEICNSEKSIPDPRIRNRIRFLDSAIRKSIIYAKIASGTPPHPEKKKISYGLMNP